MRLVGEAQNHVEIDLDWNTVLAELIYGPDDDRRSEVERATTVFSRCYSALRSIKDATLAEIREDHRAKIIAGFQEQIGRLEAVGPDGTERGKS